MRGAAIAAVGIGSNLNDPVSQVRQALAALASLPDSEPVASSSLYRNPPMGPQDQPDYVNAAMVLRTRLRPLDLLDALQAIEAKQGRSRGDLRWGPRSLDLDLLVWGDLIVDQPRLTLPHPGVHERAFVLYPLAEIAPGLVIPGRGCVRDLAAACSAAGLVKV